MLAEFMGTEARFSESGPQDRVYYAQGPLPGSRDLSARQTLGGESRRRAEKLPKAVAPR